MHSIKQYENLADCMSHRDLYTKTGDENEACMRPCGLVRGKRTERKREGVRHDVLQKTALDELNTASSQTEVRGENRMTETGKDV